MKLELRQNGCVGGFAYGFFDEQGEPFGLDRLNETDPDLLRYYPECMLAAVYDDDVKWERKARFSHRFKPAPNGLPPVSFNGIEFPVPSVPVKGRAKLPPGRKK